MSRARASLDAPADGRARWAATWCVVGAVAASLVVLVECSTRPPEARGVGGPGGAFSEERARAVAHHLSEEIGLRVAGTRACDRAAADLVAELEEIDGIEVELQDVRGEYVYDDTIFDYRVRNVIARLPGRRADAILLAAHYDSPPESVGAADNALSVGVAVEIARALAAAGPLEHTVLFLLNGGEEVGLLGADGFLEHRWSRDVRAFVNLEAAGLGGQAILFQAGPGERWLVDAYARVPRPFGTVVGQDLFQAGLISSDTDGRVFRGAGWSGLDLALFERGYLYHTSRDRLSRVDPGSAQGLGDNVLGLVRDLAGASPPQRQPTSPTPIYFDLLSRVMFVYTPGTALVLALIAGSLVAAGLALAIRRRLVRLASCAAAAGLAAAGLVLGLVAAIGAGLLTGVVLGEPHGWFDQPALALIGFGGAALLSSFALHALWSRRRARAERSADEGALAAFAGGSVVWTAIAVLLALGGVGSGYVAMLATFGAGAALVAAAWTPARVRWLPLLVGWAIGALPIIQFGANVIRLFVPMVGRMPSPSPDDPLIAVVVALPVLACALTAGAAVHRAGRPGWTSLTVGAVAVLGVALSAIGFPYSESEPKRIEVEHVDTGAGPSAVWLKAEDPLSPGALGLLAGASRASGMAIDRDWLIAPPGVLPRPVVSVTAGTSGGHGDRRVVVRFGGGDYYQLVVDLPRARIAGWSLATPTTTTEGDRLRLKVIGAQDSGRELELELRGPEPVPMVVEERYLGGTPATRRVEAALPDWCSVFSRATARSTVDL